MTIKLGLAFVMKIAIIVITFIAFLIPQIITMTKTFVPTIP